MIVDGVALESRWIGPAPGDAPTLVFLHEGLGCAARWRDVPDVLAAATGCGALVYSRAGYGASDPVALPRPLDYMEREAAALPRVLATAGVRDAVLVGHSDGGSIAIVYAATPDPAVRLRGAVLLAPHVFVEDVSVASIARAKIAYDEGDLRSKLARWHRDVDVAFRGWNYAWLDPGFRAWNLERYLPAIRAPLLVLQGRDDEYGTRAQVDAIAAGSGGPVDVRLLDRCGHDPFRDRRDDAIAAVVDLVARVRPAR